MGIGHDREEKMRHVIEGCRMLISSLADTTKQPLEREAGYILAQMLRLQVESLGLLNDPDAQRFLQMLEAQRTRPQVRRYPDDFISGLVDPH